MKNGFGSGMHGRMAWPGFERWNHGMVASLVKSRQPRGQGRMDLTLCTAIFEGMLPSSEREALRKLVFSLFQRNMRHSFHLMFIEAGADEQPEHQDSPSSPYYATCLFPLTFDNGMSGYTHFVNSPNISALPIGQAVLFDGRVLHRGTSNDSKDRRVFLYVPVFCTTDPNDE
jgi:hypothetical protein